MNIREKNTGKQEQEKGKMYGKREGDVRYLTRLRADNLTSFAQIFYSTFLPWFHSTFWESLRRSNRH